MTTLHDAARQALDAFELWCPAMGHALNKRAEAVVALRAALAEPALNPAPGYCKHCKQYTIEEPLPAKPVAWMVYTLDGKSVCVTDNPADFTDEHKVLTLYTAPPQRLPLTDEEIDAEWRKAASEEGFTTAQFVRNFARAIERTHGIGEQQ